MWLFVVVRVMRCLYTQQNVAVCGSTGHEMFVHLAKCCCLLCSGHDMFVHSANAAVCGVLAMRCLYTQQMRLFVVSWSWDVCTLNKCGCLWCPGQEMFVHAIKSSAVAYITMITLPCYAYYALKWYAMLCNALLCYSMLCYWCNEVYKQYPLQLWYSNNK